jgi:hypothetical protein
VGATTITSSGSAGGTRRADSARPPVLLMSGPIFGLRMRELMRATAEFGRGLGKPVATFSLLDEIFQAEGNLPANPYQDVLPSAS